jgi:23S rRNA pseudouridine2605 synthase
MEERLQKILARAGFGSRRKCEELIRQGRVAVNRQTAELGQKADPENDLVTLDGEPVVLKRRFTYVALHKPRDVLSDEGDGSGRFPTVLDLVPLPEHLFPVGRLDLRSEGLVLLTDDGGLANRLMHPRYGHEREYRALVEGEPDEAALEKWRQGVFLDGQRTVSAEVTVIGREDGAGADGGTSYTRGTWLRVVLREGRKRQIRRVAAMLGYPVRRLVRVRIGSLLIGNLKPGQWRKLSEAEVKALQSSTREGPQVRGRREGRGRQERKPVRSSVQRMSTSKRRRGGSPAGVDRSPRGGRRTGRAGANGPAGAGGPARPAKQTGRRSSKRR